MSHPPSQLTDEPSSSWLRLYGHELVVCVSSLRQGLPLHEVSTARHKPYIIRLTRLQYITVLQVQVRNNHAAAAAAASIVFNNPKSRSVPRLAKHDLPAQGRTDTEKLNPAEEVDPVVAVDPGAPVDVPFDQQLVTEDDAGKGPKFETLKGRVSYDTLKAITVKPHRLTHMSPVQAEVLPLLPEIAEPYSPDPPADGSKRPPRDLLVKARTGTGKTLAFLVPAIEARLKAIEEAGRQAIKDAGLVSDKHMEARVRRIFTREQVGTLIISPTRELATQIANEALRLTHHHKDFEVRLFVGGQSKRMQMRDWMKGRRDIVVATPGRLRDLLMSEPEIVRGISKTKTVSTPFYQLIVILMIPLSSSSTKPIPCSTWASGTTSTQSPNTSLPLPSAKHSYSPPPSLGQSNKSLVARWTKTTCS